MNTSRQQFGFDVARPSDFWLVRRADGVVADPEVEDDPGRSYSEGPVDWAVVARIVADIGSQLSGVPAGTMERRVQSPDLHAGLDGATLGVVTSWFSLGAGVLGEPSHLDRGRRRLRKAWQAAPSALLPVRSTVRMLFDEQGPRTTRASAAEVLRDAPETVWA